MDNFKYDFCNLNVFLSNLPKFPCFRKNNGPKRVCAIHRKELPFEFISTPHFQSERDEDFATTVLLASKDKLQESNLIYTFVEHVLNSSCSLLKCTSHIACDAFETCSSQMLKFIPCSLHEQRQFQSKGF